MRLLKRTSKHHQPAHLAAAVALGLVVGLVPKANLLAVGLYAALLLLPIHTWLALTVSLIVACGASYLDPLTHALGSWLLRQSILTPLWYLLDSTAFLPWLGLHNTVVVGSLVGGVTLAAPTYLMSLRLFERLKWRAAAPSQITSEETILLAPTPAERAAIPAPKFAGTSTARSQPASLPAAHAPTEEQFEPAREVAAIINSWHMGHAAHNSLQLRTVSALGANDALGAKDQQPRASSAMGARGDAADPQPPEARFLPHSFTPPPRLQGRERSDIVDSLDLAQSAGEVLAWVDEALEDCLSDDSARLVAHDLHTSNPIPISSAHALPTEPPAEPNFGEEQWLMETTIEVVRWGDGARPAVQPTDTPPESAALQSMTDHNASQAASTPAISNQSPTATALPRAADGPAPRAADATRRNAEMRNRMSIVPFVQPGSQLGQAALPDAESHPSDGADLHRGECLGYLLGHLRQEREGRST